MKKFRIFILMCLAILVLGALSACGLPELSRPSNLKLDKEKKILTWSAVDNARGYVVEIVGKRSVTTDKTSYSFENVELDEGKYTIRVKARGNGIDYDDSAWATVSYTQPYTSGMKYTLINNDTEYEITSYGKATGDVVIDDLYNGLPVTSISKLAFSNTTKITSVTFGKYIKTVSDRAFYSCAGMTSLTLNDRLETIESMAFQGCSELLEVKIPDSVKTIGESAFAYCSKLKNIDFGNSVESLGVTAFISTKELTQAVLPRSLLNVGESAFAQSGIRKIVLNTTANTQYGKSVFSQCKSLTEIDFGEDMTTITDSMFQGCASLKSVVIPSCVKEIGKTAFYDCLTLSDVSIGENVTSIGSNVFVNTIAYRNGLYNHIYIIDKWVVGRAIDGGMGNEAVDMCTQEDFDSLQNKDIVGICYGAFAGCANLVTVSIPDTVKYICRQAFDRCPNITSVRLGRNTLTVGYGAFYICENLQFVLMNELLETIDSYAFAYCYKLQSGGTAIPQTVTRIGTQAFYRSGIWDAQAFPQEELTDVGVFAAAEAKDGLIYLSDWLIGCDVNASGNVKIRDGIKAIADYAFAYCKKLSDIRLPASVKSIGTGAFYMCTAEEVPNGHLPSLSVNIPSGVTEIKDNTFAGSGIGKISIPDSVTKIGIEAFRSSINLSSVIIPDSVTEIGSGAFTGCSSLNSVVLSKNIDIIVSYLFKDCVSLVSIEIPEKVQSIEIGAFFHCDALKNVEFGDNVWGIGAYSFYMCGSLKAVDLPSKLRRIDSYAFYKSGIETLELDSQVESIGYAAFYGCDFLRKVTLSDSLSAIGERAFMLCPVLEDVVLGRNIVNIGNYAFYGCHTATFYCEADKMPLTWDTRWNAMYRPALFGCAFDTDGSLRSVLKDEDTVYNYNAVNGLFAPSRDGYEFVGWSTNENAVNAEYALNDFINAPDGTVLYAVWAQATGE